MTASARVMSLEEELKVTHESNNEHASLLALQIEENANLRAKFVESQEVINQLTAEKIKLRESLGGTVIEKQRLTERVAELTKEQIEGRDQVATIARLEALLAAKQREYEHEIRLWGGRCQAKDAKITELTNAGEWIRKQYSELQAAMTTAADDVANLTQLVAKFTCEKEEEARKWTTARDRIEAELTRLHEAVSEKETTITTATAEMTKMQMAAVDENAKLKAQIDIRVGQLQLLQLRFDNVKQLIDELQHQVRVLIEEKTRRDTIIQRLQEQGMVID
jgi:chromosome segregation ATPase